VATTAALPLLPEETRYPKYGDFTLCTADFNGMTIGD
jgi:hypothetical protein